MLVEPACGASLAVIYSSVLQKLQADGRLPASLDNVIIIVCGGSGVNLQVFDSYKSVLSGAA